MALKYVTVANVAAFLGVDGSDAVIAGELESYAYLAEELVETYCGQTFDSETAATKYVDGNGLNVLPLPKPIRSLTSAAAVDLDGVAATAYSYVVVGPSDPSVSGCYTHIMFEDGVSTFPVGVGNIKVIGNWGYTTFPKMFTYAIYYTIKHLLAVAKLDETVSRESSFGKEAVYSKLDMIPRSAQFILTKFRAKEMCINVT
jgi:hypothetical protein